MTRRGRTARASGERGFALVAVLGVMTLLMGLGAALHSGTIAETVLRGGHRRATDGFYAAESGINRGMAEYKNIFFSYSIPSGADFDPRSFTLNNRNIVYQLTPVPGYPIQKLLGSGAQFAGLNAIEYSYTATSAASLTAGDVEAAIGSQFNVDYVPLFQFLAFYQGDLEILPGPNMSLTGPVHTNGTLYLNSNTNCSGSPCVGGLEIKDAYPTVTTVSVTAAGDVFRGRKDVSQCLGTVTIAKKLVDADHNNALDLQQMPCSGTQSASQLSTWLGSIKSKQPRVTVPSPSVLARGGEYWNKADLRIALMLSSPDGQGRYPIRVLAADQSIDGAKDAELQNFMQLNGGGRIFYSDVPEPGKSNAEPTPAAPHTNSYVHRQSYNPDFLGANEVYACPRGDSLAPATQFDNCAAVVQNQGLSGGGVTARRGGFYNNREHAWVYMLNVNLHDLVAWNRAQGGPLFPPDDATDGGVVIYLTVVGAGSTGAIPSPRYGVRVFGTPDFNFAAPGVDPTGITMVSDQAFYVEGNYNNGTAGFVKMPAAVMADTVNVLSANWSGEGVGSWPPAGTSALSACRNDCQSFQVLDARPGAATTINSAFLAGVDTTSAGNYNGGFENYPRFHESWSGNLNYRGSFVSLGMPTRANGAWCGTGPTCNIYNPPVRNWNYETAFQLVENLPPLTPRVVAVQQILFTENFR
jgi:hypothetical protein